jgi:hypothetical protein
MALCQMVVAVDSIISKRQLHEHLTDPTKASGLILFIPLKLGMEEHSLVIKVAYGCCCPRGRAHGCAVARAIAGRSEGIRLEWIQYLSPGCVAVHAKQLVSWVCWR